MLERTLVLELHIARLQGQLAGDTPEARFTSFTAQLRDRGAALALLEEYPVLARAVITRAGQAADAVAELMARLNQDWPELLSTFFGGRSPGRLAAVAMGEGDTHRDGRSVAVLTFADGRKLVYKPRSLAVDVHFQQLLMWLNDRGAATHPIVCSLYSIGAPMDGLNLWRWPRAATPRKCGVSICVRVAI